MPKDVKLSNGAKMPIIGLGTWELRGKECTEVVQKALDIGYRHIDTAHSYENHAAIKKGIVNFKREELYITSKIPLEKVDGRSAKKSVREMFEKALKALGVEYLDLYLIHSPDRQKPMRAVLETMLEFCREGKLKNIGVSNFNVHHLQDVSDLPVAVNQVEFHPYLYQKELLEFCRKNKIILEAYRPFGKGPLPQEEVFQKIGKNHSKTGAQVILRWMVQKMIPVLPKASSENHLKENLAVFDFELTDAEMKQLDRLNQNKRFCFQGWEEFNY